MGQGGVACPKPEPRKRAKDRQLRVSRAATRDVRAYVFDREANICRCCRLRPAESMHEIRSRGAGGKVSKKNSIAVCGRIVGAVPSCHTYLQSCEIRCHVNDSLGADGDLFFQTHTQAAADWLRVKYDQHLVSGPTPRIRGEQE